LDDKPFQEVIGMNGTLNRDQDDFGNCGKAADSPFALEETAFALTLEPWEEWLGMEIDSDTLNEHAAAQIVANCLWEMTFHGFSQTQICEEREELQRRVAELDAMTKEERQKNLMPAEKLFQELKAKLEKPS